MLGPLRANRSTAIVIGSVVFLVAFVSLAYNHLDNWEPAADVSDTGDLHIGTHDAFSKPSGPSNASTELTDYYLKYIMGPSVGPTTPEYAPQGAFPLELPKDLPKNSKWDKLIGEDLCIIDLDNRPFDKPGQIFSPDFMSWERAAEVHGLSAGVLNHWVYAKIHGYKYYYVNIDTFEDRRASWKKPTIMAKILKKHKACIYLDSDAIFYHLDLPFEWVMNYWNLHPDTNSMALAADPTHKNNMDKFEKVYLNTGFIVAQNNEKTFEIMEAWDDCANDGGKHPDCIDFRKNRPGKPTDQGGFGTYIRYDYPKDVKELPCTEGNGFPESKSGCEGKFIKHFWTGKNNHIKVAVGQQMPGAIFETFHKQFMAERDSFIITEQQLMAN